MASSGSPVAVRVSDDEGAVVERALIQMARTALLQGQSANALAALEQHAREFPRGRLAEEGEVLAIQALAGAGRSEEARARAARFRERHPTSLWLPSVEVAVPKERP